MLTDIWNALKEFFREKSPYEDLERYIVAHEPKTTADVEFWTEQYEREVIGARRHMKAYYGRGF
jgi:hypothetical protein